MKWMSPVSRFDGNGIPASSSECKRGCCWTQYGHSAVAGACACHKPQGARTGDNTPGRVLVHVDEKQTSQIADSGNTRSEEIGYV